MAAKPINGRSWRKVPLICVEAFSVKCGLVKTETGTGTEHGWPELLRNPANKLLAQVPCPMVWIFHRHLCNLGVELTKQNRFLEQVSIHLPVVHQLSWIQGLTLNTQLLGLIIADTQGRNEVTCSPSHLLIWHHLFSSHQGTETKEVNVGQNCPE
jgi:hypothetical protein